MKRRDTLKLGAALALPAGTVHADAQGRKVLRVVFPVAETGFDPARVSDIYSATVNAHIFESLLRYDHLTRPVAVRTRTAAALPEHSDDFRVWTVRIRPGIFFADDPAFKGQKRELTAHDYVYTAKRFADPANKSPNWPSVHEWRLLGLAELRDKALKDKTPFDYDTPIEGLRALDRYTVQFTLQRPQPRFAYQLAVTATFGALAREVVEAYGDKIMEHPVGTGPYRLAQWRRSSFIALERNPNYREHVYDAQPAPDDAEGQAIAQRMKGQRLPVVDRVEVSIIEEAQPRWLSFLNGQSDLAAVPQEFVPVAMPGGKLAPNLAKKGIQGWRVLMPFTQLTFFNMDHPLVGGYEPHKVALRRAVFLALDSQREIDLVFRGQAIPAQGIVGPHCFGWSDSFKTENGDVDVPRAKALLDLYGWVDRNGDGWREQPDGQPLELECATQPEGLSRQRDELMKKAMDAIGIRVSFKPAKWPENLKSARAGKLMMWRVGSSATVPDGQQILQRLYGPETGQGNLSRFRLKAFDEVFDRLTTLPDGPERAELMQRAQRIAIAWAPYKVHLHQYADTLAQPWLQGYRRPLFWYDWWQWVDVLPHPEGNA